ncbi:MAG: aromatic amino acid lyase [Ectothiorhodospiraceae bacterium]|nr:aromatic amino acid lyase [Ectothiorhodospiraceae bacterium]MCH8505232.1 aromatic amino acid ammonia-lyase [Ectothiorhodospiraceae bacterium]
MDALALVNGTAAMTGIAALNGLAARRCVDLAMRCTVTYAECLNGRLEAWERALGAVRPHPGQQEAHQRLLALSAGSQRLTPVHKHYLARQLGDDKPVRNSKAIPQDPYTIRCAPQLFGAILDVIDFHNSTAEALTQVHEIQAIGAITMAQGVDLLGKSGFGAASQELRDWVRTLSAAITTDRPLYADIRRVAEALQPGGGGTQSRRAQDPRAVPTNRGAAMDLPTA